MLRARDNPARVSSRNLWFCFCSLPERHSASVGSRVHKSVPIRTAEPSAPERMEKEIIIIKKRGQNVSFNSHAGSCGTNRTDGELSKMFFVMKNRTGLGSARVTHRVEAGCSVFLPFYHAVTARETFA